MDFRRRGAHAISPLESVAVKTCSSGEKEDGEEVKDRKKQKRKFKEKDILSQLKSTRVIKRCIFKDKINFEGERRALDKDLKHPRVPTLLRFSNPQNDRKPR